MRTRFGVRSAIGDTGMSDNEQKQSRLLIDNWSFLPILQFAKETFRESLPRGSAPFLIRVHVIDSNRNFRYQSGSQEPQRLTRERLCSWLSTSHSQLSSDYISVRIISSRLATYPPNDSCRAAWRGIDSKFFWTHKLSTIIPEAHLWGMSAEMYWETHVTSEITEQRKRTHTLAHSAIFQSKEHKHQESQTQNCYGTQELYSCYSHDCYRSMGNPCILSPLSLQKLNTYTHSYRDITYAQSLSPLSLPKIESCSYMNTVCPACICYCVKFINA